MSRTSQARTPRRGERHVSQHGPPGAVGGWAPPPFPPGPQDLPRDYGPDGSAGGLKPEYPAASGPRDYGSGPTTGTRSQTTCYVRRGTGRVVYCNDLLSSSFYLQSAHRAGDRTILLNLLCSTTTSKVSLRFESAIKGRGGHGRLSPPLSTFCVRYTRALQ